MDNFENEEWVDIAGYEGVYQVSNLGRIKSLGRWIRNAVHGQSFFKTKILSQKTSNGGYMCISLHKDGIRKMFLIHRLVAIHFIPNPKNKPEVNHINGIKTDNRVENLEWSTASENQLHSHRIGLYVSRKGVDHHFAKLTEDQVLEIRAIKNINQSATARKFNVTVNLIHLIIHRKIWKHI